jgi:hypothetical protein
MPDDVDHFILSGQLEIGVVFTIPAVEDLPDGDAPILQVEGDRPLICPKARVCFHSETNRRRSAHPGPLLSRNTAGWWILSRSARADGVLDCPPQSRKDHAAPDCLDHLKDREGSWIVVYNCALPLQVDVYGRRSTQPLQGPPDPKSSKGADHSGDGEFRAPMTRQSLQGLRPNQASHGGDTEVPQFHLHRFLLENANLTPYHSSEERILRQRESVTPPGTRNIRMPRLPRSRAGDA